ncbi:putative autolysis signal peptide Pep27 [Streptococcus pneumoniae]|nr:putative autolysis signal peptide Pep27 [Streptococcus pneumoniae]
MRKEFHNVLSSGQLLTDKRPARDYNRKSSMYLF